MSTPEDRVLAALQRASDATTAIHEQLTQLTHERDTANQQLNLVAHHLDETLTEHGLTKPLEPIWLSFWDRLLDGADPPPRQEPDMPPNTQWGVRTPESRVQHASRVIGCRDYRDAWRQAQEDTTLQIVYFSERKGWEPYPRRDVNAEQVGSASRNEEVAATADEIVGVDQDWLVVVVPHREPAVKRAMSSSYQQPPPPQVEKRKAKSALAAANMVSRDPGDRVYVARLVDVTVFDRPLQPELVIVKADA